MTNFWYKLALWALSKYLKRRAGDNAQTGLAAILRLQRVYASNNDIDFELALRESREFS